MQQLHSEVKEANTNQSSQSKSRKPNKLEDDLAVSAIFLSIGLILHFFAFDTNTASWDGFYQFLSYLSYAISFFGGAVGIDQHSKKETYSDIGFGAGCSIIAYWLHTGVMNLRNANMVWAVIVELVFIVFVAMAAYGVVRGITRIFIYPKQKPSIVEGSAPIPDKTKRERIVSYTLAFLSLFFGFIQALPIIIEYVKTIFHLQ